jgi:hypothetical protein
MTCPYRTLAEMPKKRVVRDPVNWNLIILRATCVCAAIALLALPVLAFYESAHRSKVRTVKVHDCTCEVDQ